MPNDGALALGRDCNGAKRGADATGAAAGEPLPAKWADALVAALHELPLAVTLKDRHGRYVMANPTAARILGFPSPATMIGRTADDLFSAEEAARIRREDAALLAMERTSYQTDGVFNDVDGRRGRYLGTKATLRDADGRALGVFAVRYDVTAQERDHRLALVMLGVARAISEARDLRGAVEGTITVVCRHTGWAYGEAWMLVPTEAERLDLFCHAAADDRGTAFFAASRSDKYDVRNGLIGASMRANAPLFYGPDELADPARFVRAGLGREAGFQSAVTVPVADPRGCQIAIMAFFDRETLDEELRQLVAQAVMSLGPAFDQKLLEEKLRRSQQRYHAIVEGQQEYISRYAPDGTRRFTNRAYAEFLGDEPDSLLGSSLFDTIDPEDVDSLKERLANLAPDAPSFIREGRHRRHDDEYRLIEWQSHGLFDDEGRLMEIQAVGRDVTERRQAEEALRRSEQRYHAIVQGQSEFIFRFSPDGVRTFVNDAYAAFLGVPPAELLAQPMYEVVHPDDRGGLESHLASLTAEHPRGSRVFRHRRHDGTYRQIEWTDHALFDGDGGIKEFQAVGRDITERTRMEEELRARTHALGERVKESRCLYAISDYLTATGRPLTLRLAKLVNILPHGFQHVEVAGARVTAEGHEYASARFEESPWSIQERIVADGEVVGQVRVTYREVRPAVRGGEGAFLAEERSLLREVARRIGEAVQHERWLQQTLGQRQRYEQLVSKVPAAVLVHLADRIVYANPAALGLFGADGGEALLGTPIWSRIHPEDVERKKARADAALKGREVPGMMELRCLRLDGTPVEVESQAVRCEWEGQPAVQLLVRDISAHKALERVIRENERRYRKALEVAPHPMLIHDGRHILYCNPRAAQLLGADSPSQLASADWPGFIHPDDRELARARIAMLLGAGANERISHLQYRIRRLDGEELTVEAVGTCLEWDGVPAVQVIAQDITPRKRAEAALRESELRFRTLIDETSQGIIVHDGDRVLYANDGALRAFDVDGVMALERVVFGIELADDAAIAALRELFLAEPDEAAGEVLEVAWPQQDGTTAFLEIRPTSVPWDGKDAICCSIFDVSRRHELELQLRRAHRMDAIGQLTGGIAHDFNNLLTVVQGNLQMLERIPHAHEKAARWIATARHAAKRGAELTSRLLAFSRRQMLAPEVCNLNESVQALSELLTRTLGERVQLHIVPDWDLPSVELDLPQFESALVNLAVNARDAMPDGGRLSIETECVRLTEPRMSDDEVLPSGAYVVVSVTDTGTGIPAELVSRVCEPFFTTKEVGKGTGLGLSMVYGFVRQSGGGMRIESDGRSGTTIRLLFPAVVGRTPAAGVDDGGTEMPGGSETLLIVEDDEDVRESTVGVFETLGYKILEARNAEEALRCLEASPDVALLLTDVVMPGKFNGLELGRIALSQRPDLKVVVTSGYSDDAIDNYMDSGMNSTWVTKPYDYHALAVLIRRLLDGEEPPATDEKGVRS